MDNTKLLNTVSYHDDISLDLVRTYLMLVRVTGQLHYLDAAKTALNVYRGSHETK